jgi:hypothetical protein
MKNKELKEYVVNLLTATICKDENIPEPYCGYINEVKGCIAQAKTEEECKQILLELYSVKQIVEYKKSHN